MKILAKIFLILAGFGAFAIVEHQGYEYAEIQGCKSALIADNQIPDSALERLDKPMTTWCEQILDH